jgi:hypothetical protein
MKRSKEERMRHAPLLSEMPAPSRSRRCRQSPLRQRCGVWSRSGTRLRGAVGTWTRPGPTSIRPESSGRFWIVWSSRRSINSSECSVMGRPPADGSEGAPGSLAVCHDGGDWQRPAPWCEPHDAYRWIRGACRSTPPCSAIFGRGISRHWMH